MQQLVEQLYTVGSIRAMINIQDFIKLLGKEVEDSPEDLIKSIAELHIGPNRDVEIDKEVIN